MIEPRIPTWLQVIVVSVLLAGSMHAKCAKALDESDNEPTMRDIAIGFLISNDWGHQFERCPEMIHVDENYYYYRFANSSEYTSNPEVLVLVSKKDRKALWVEDAKYPLFFE